VRNEMLCYGCRRELAPSTQRNRQKQLVGKMRPDGCDGCQVASSLRNSALRHRFCGNALLTESGEHLGHVLVLNRYGEGVAGPHVTWQAAHMKLLTWPVQHLADDFELPRGYMERDTGNIGFRIAPATLAPLQEAQARKLSARLNARDYLPTPADKTRAGRDPD
jgi:hypothetical protein